MLKLRGLPILVLSVFAAAILAGCVAKEPPASARNSAGWGAQQLIAEAQTDAQKSLKEDGRGQARAYAEQGIDAAERCLMVAPEEPGCYYWRAVTTGLYHRVHVIGYQKGVKRMIEDCKKVIQLDPGYDQAGCYRILGELYTKLPQTGGSPDSVVRDLPLAEQYLRQAVQLAPDYPENHIALAQTLVEQENTVDVGKVLGQAKALTPRWKSDVSYSEWHDSIVALEKKVQKISK